MQSNENVLVALSPGGDAKGMLRVPAGSDRMLRELTSLGLTEHASLGILMVLMRRDPPPAVIDPDEF